MLPPMRAILSLGVLVSFALACGGAPPAPVAPAASIKSAALPPPAPEVAADLGAVPEPPSLVISGTLAKPSAALAVAHGWSNLPMPQSEQVSEMITTEAVGAIVDLDKPIDFALAVVGSGARAKRLVAVSAAVADPEKTKSSLAERYTLISAGNGAMLVQGLGRASHDEDDEADDDDNDKRGGGDKSGDDEDRRTCELAPAYGAAPMRLVCGMNAKAVSELGPWLTRTATRAVPTSDLHVEARMKPLKETIAEGKRQISMILGFFLGGAIGGGGRSGARNLLAALGNDLGDFALDLDGMSLDVAVSDPGADASATVRFGTTTSGLARVGVAHPERNAQAPAAFWQLPGDADVAFFHRGIAEKEMNRARELALGAIGDVLAEGGLKEVDRKALLDALSKLVSPAAAVYGSGVDAAAVRKALAAEKALGRRANPADQLEARRASAEALLGWKVIEVDEPGAKITAAAKELAAAWSRPGVGVVMQKKAKGEPMPVVRAAAPPKGSSAGTEHFIVELATARPTTMGPHGGAPPADAKDAKKTAGPAKPLAIHVLVAADGPRTWIAVGGSEALIASKLAATIASGGDKLAARTDLAPLKEGNIGSGGFLTARALPETSEQSAALSGGSTWGASERFDAVASLPHQGLSPVIVTFTPQNGSAPAAVVGRVRVSKATIEDTVMAVIRNGF